MLTCRGAGFSACERSIQPIRKLTTEANVIHKRMPVFIVFIFLLNYLSLMIVIAELVPLGQKNIPILVNPDDPSLLQLDQDGLVLLNDLAGLA